MTDACACVITDVALLGGSLLGASAAQARSIMPIASEISASLMISGGSSAHDVVAGGNRQQLFGAARSRPDRRSARRCAGRSEGPRRALRKSPTDSDPSVRRAAASAAAPFCLAWSRKPGASTTSSTALPTRVASGLPPKVEPCVPAVMPFAASAGRKTGADREAAAERFRQRHDVGRNAAALIAEQFAGAAEAGLHFVEHQHQAVLVAQLAQRTQEFPRHDAHAAFALDRLDHDRRGLRRDRLLRPPRCRRMATWSKPLDHRAEAFEIFLADRRPRASPACGRGMRPRR